MEYTGYKNWTPNDEELALFYQSKECPISLVDNEYLIIRDKSGEMVDKYCYQMGTLRQVPFVTFRSEFAGAIKPLNSEQILAFDMLHDKGTTIKLLTGGYGCGKTFLLAAAAMEALDKGRFQRIVWVRNNIRVKDTGELGALPGSEFDKLLPYVMPLADHCGGIDGIRSLIEDQKLEVVDLGTIRGRDIKNAVILCSEAENLTKEHLQLLIGRCGKGTNLWLDADVRQRDKVTFEKSKGIEKMIERFSGKELFGYVKLLKTERSKTAQMADLLDD